jgi:hypothetical protein
MIIGQNFTNVHRCRKILNLKSELRGVLSLASKCRCLFFFNFFTTQMAGHPFNSRKSAPPPAATYHLRGGEYKDPITPPCGTLLRLSADTLFPAI